MALEEAAKAQGRTHPNPVVGCVVVKNGRLIAKGYHTRAGMPHAEAVALRKAGARARGADVYVTLEPCNHHGRTGPCTESLIQAGVRRVYVGMRDPHPLVNGKGLRALRRAGIEVHTGVLEKACQDLNAPFVWSVTHQKPWVAVKIAQSLDGRVATCTGQSQWITGPKARLAGHRLRNVYDVLMVGVGTVLADNPKLTCRMPKGRDPIRVVLDTHAHTPLDSEVVKAARTSKAPTWVCVGTQAPEEACALLRERGVEVFRCGHTDEGVDVQEVLRMLHARGVLSVLVEGGPRVTGALLDAHLVQKVHVYVAPMIIGGKGALCSVMGQGASVLQQSAFLKNVVYTHEGPDMCLTADVFYKGGSDA